MLLGLPGQLGWELRRREIHGGGEAFRGTGYTGCIDSHLSLGSAVALLYWMVIAPVCVCLTRHTIGLTGSFPF